MGFYAFMQENMKGILSRIDTLKNRGGHKVKIV
jgi:hypothetical protein